MGDFRHVKISELYFYAMWLLAGMLYILIPIQSSFVRFIYIGIVAVTIGTFLVWLIDEIRLSKSQFNNKRIVLFFIILLIIVFSAILGIKKMTFQIEIMGVIGYLEMLAALLIIDKVPFSERNLRYVFAINILLSFVFILLSQSNYAYFGVLEWLDLGYSNPNATAMYLLLNQAILLISFSRFNRKWMKIAILAICVYEEYLIYLTGSRTCLIASLLVILFAIFGKKLKVPKFLITISMIFPLVFLVVYAALYSVGKYEDFSILGKEFFSGREEYFITKIGEFIQQPIIGDASRYYFTNMHNAPLAILSSSGVLGYLAYLMFYRKTILHYYPSKPSRIQNVALVAILATFLHSSSEAALMVGGAHYSIIVATMYWILKGDTNEAGSKITE